MKKKPDLKKVTGENFLSKVTGENFLSKVALPLGCAMAGSIAGAAAGKTYNLGVGLLLATAGLAMSQPNLVYAGAGAMAVTPAAPATVAGLDGFSDVLLGMKNRALSQTKGLFSNARLSVISDKIPVSGLSGLGEFQDAYEQGYIEGVEDSADDQQHTDLSGAYNYGQTLLPASPQAAPRMSIEAMQMSHYR